MSTLDIAAFRATPLRRDPYEYLIVPGFVRGDALDGINADFPKMDRPGSFPTSTLSFGPRFKALLDDFESPALRAAMAEKFAVDLEGRPTTITVRGRCRQSDGKIHTDTESKIITVLVYMNPAWEAPGGRLRILRGPDRLDDCADEVPPTAGTLLAFRRSEKSWHGHESFEGERRALQLNWVTDQATVDRELARHRLSAFFKRLNPFG
ncbi:MAG: 2OG-Fe(II) oxygenase [Rhodospirillales bacterium]|nr:2OG-Fe(II) oxygenase [Rhodospirillales bacterium]